MKTRTVYSILACILFAALLLLCSSVQAAPPRDPATPDCLWIPGGICIPLKHPGTPIQPLPMTQPAQWTPTAIGTEQTHEQTLRPLYIDGIWQ